MTCHAESSTSFIAGRCSCIWTSAIGFSKMVAALGPGGIILVEEGDRFTADAITSDVVRKVFKIFGGSWTWASSLPERLTELGLSEVGSEIWANVYQGGSKHALFFAQSIEGVRHLLTTTGRVTDAEVDEALTALRDPAVWVPPPAALVAAWGRRAG